MSFGTGPVLHRLRPGPTVGAKARLDRRDDADHALWSFFKNAALKAGAHMAMDKRLEEQAARSGLLSSSSLRKAAAARDRTALDNHRHGARIWQKAIPMVLAAMRNPLHHHSVVDAALNLLNSLIQPKCTTAIGACSVAVQAGLIPSLKKLLVTDMLMSSSTTVLEACAVLRRVASIPRHRATLTKVNNGIEQLLVDLIVKRPAPGVVDVALHCLQNMCVAATSAKRVLDTSPVGGVRAITMLLNDSVSVDGVRGCVGQHCVPWCDFSSSHRKDRDTAGPAQQHLCRRRQSLCVCCPAVGSGAQKPRLSGGGRRQRVRHAERCRRPRILALAPKSDRPKQG